ncbi:MAG TPA: hemerythrin domain-containing protein [Kofleriaceae bacterium]|jgi:hemerythrin superfamily protein
MANPIDIVASKARGLEKSMEAHRDGLVGVFQTLAKQHGEVASLIERLRNDASKRESLWPLIRVALIAHERAELEAVYPVLEVIVGLRGYVERHAIEANDLENRIMQLEGSLFQGDTWMSQFDELGDAVTAHAAEEEHEIFPAALAAIDEHHAKQLDDRFKAAHKRERALLEKTQH